MSVSKADRDKAILLASSKGGKLDLFSQVRALLVGAMRSPARAVALLHATAGAETFHRSIVSNWTPHTDLVRAGGYFNVLDLRCWLALADYAGVPAIPAQEVLSIPVDDVDLVLGGINISALVRESLGVRWRRTADFLAQSLQPSNAMPTDCVSPQVGSSVEKEGTPQSTSASQTTEDREDRREAVKEMLFAALDDVPDNYMVRSANVGPESLKSLAGVGAIGERAPEVRINDHVAVGPGWVRVGNRRAIDIVDLRIGRAHMEGDQDGPIVFLARPWVKPTRWLRAPDPHTQGTALAAEGQWPAEWRAFVYDGQVTAVACYYAWAGAVDRQSAQSAIAVRDLAQRIVDAGVSAGAKPQFTTLEHIRRGVQKDIADSRLPGGGFHATIDFIEARGSDGRPDILLLEGGPAYDPHFPGGHPCAFAGISRPRGVAFKTMDGVDLADQSTYCFKAADREAHARDFPGLSRDGAIFSWDAVEKLAL